MRYEGLESWSPSFWIGITTRRRGCPAVFRGTGPINLGLPPVDPFQEAQQLRAVAVAQATTADWSPIAVRVEGKPPSAVIYDQFRLLGLAARAAAAKGTPVDPANAPAGIGMVVLVYPYPCEERLLAPADVAIHGPNGALVPRALRQALSPDQVARVRPRQSALPDGAKAFAYPLARPRPNDTVVAHYLEDGCEVQGNVLAVAVPATILPKLIDAPTPELPRDAEGPATVFLQAIVDFEGRFQQPVYIGGPGELEPAAREAISKWRAEPARIMGALLAA